MTPPPSRSLLQKLLPFFVILIAVGLAALLIVSKPEPKPADLPETKPPLVETLVVQPTKLPLRIEAQGTVRPKRQINLSSQIAGQVIRTAENFTEGGLISKGEMLAEVDPADFKLALRQAKAQLKQAEYNLTLAEAGKQVAESDLEAFRSSALAGANNSGDNIAQSPLARYEPQVENAQAAVESARAAVDRARLNLTRTRITSPFDARVRTQHVDTGQYLTPGTPVATIYARTPLDVQVSLPLSDLQWLTSQQEKDDSPAQTTVKVHTVLDGRNHEWVGNLTRTLGELDEVGRLARFVVEVKELRSNLGLSLRVGMFVTVSVLRRSSEEIIALPQSALSRDFTVWVVKPDDTLEPRTVTVGRSNREWVVIRKGLKPGERVVATALPEALPGLKVRPLQKRADTEGEPQK